MGGVDSRCIGQQLQRAGRIARQSGVGRLAAQFVRRAGNEPVEKGPHLAFRQRTGKFVDRFAIDEGLDTGDTAHAVACRELLVLVRIDLGEQELAVVFGREFFQDGLQLLARAAPGCPEIDHHRAMLRFFEDALRKVGEADVESMFGHGTSA